MVNKQRNQTRETKSQKRTKGRRKDKRRRRRRRRIVKKKKIYKEEYKEKDMRWARVVSLGL